MRTCQHCGTDNDGTRVFCGNCGTRLPEQSPSVPGDSAGKPPAGAAPGLAAPPLPGVPQRRPKKSFRPEPVAAHGATGFLVSSFFWLAVVSATLACLIQMVREPDNIPAAVGADAAAALETFSTLKGLESSLAPSSWIINSKAINQFLESTIKMKPSEAGLPAMGARFERAFVKLNKGSFVLGIDQKFLGADLYFLLDLDPQITEAGLGVKPTGGSIGRVPVHPALMSAFLRLFEPVTVGLFQPLELLRKANSVTITLDDATLKWPGTGKTP